MPSDRAATIVRLPRRTLRALKEAAVREGKSLNRLILEMAENALRRPAQTLGVPKDDPIWQIGKDPFHSGCADLAENHDFYLHGPVTYRPPEKS